MSGQGVRAELLGRGIAVPTWLDGTGVPRRAPRIAPTGGVAESAGPERIEEAIRIVLGTRPGERVMRPDFGCDLLGLVFAPHDATTANLVRYRVGDALARWEPRIEVLDVEVRDDPAARRDGLLEIGVQYRIRATGEASTVTVPLPGEPSAS